MKWVVTILKWRIKRKAVQSAETTSGEAYQDQRAVIKAISSVDIDPIENHFLADFQISSSTGITEGFEAFAEVEWVITSQVEPQVIMFTFFELIFAAPA
jgi:hypothetical protein